MRRFLIPIVLIVAGAVVGLLTLELLLQAAAFALRLTLSVTPMEWAPGQHRVLCLGDSNTYGLYMRNRADAYPDQLERLWNDSGLQPQIDVLNAGYPGTNSSRLRKNFRPMLETIRPDVAIVLVGANDYWTVRVPVDESRAWFTVLADAVRQHSRLYHLIYMAARGVDRRDFAMPDAQTITAQHEQTVRYGDVEFSFGYERQQRRRDDDAQLVANLEAVAEEARRFNTRLIFLTYPSKESNYGDAGRLIRVAAAKAEVPLIDMEKVFAALCPKEPCPELFFKDHHATAQGYRLMAETLVQQKLGAE